MSARPKAARISEAVLHKQVADYLNAVIRPPSVWTTIAHGGGGKIRGAMLKARGLKKGWPDIMVIAPGPNVLGIELKRKGGTQSPEQREVEIAFHGCKAWYVLCRSVEEVERAVAFVIKPSGRAT